MTIILRTETSSKRILFLTVTGMQNWLILVTVKRNWLNLSWTIEERFTMQRQRYCHKESTIHTVQMCGHLGSSCFWWPFADSLMQAVGPEWSGNWFKLKKSWYIPRWTTMSLSCSRRWWLSIQLTDAKLNSCWRVHGLRKRFSWSYQRARSWSWCSKGCLTMPVLSNKNRLPGLDVRSRLEKFT
jgi:hypothetical protein